MLQISRAKRSVAGLLLCGGCATAPVFHGPMATRNQHPAQLAVGRLEPRTAAVAPGGGAELAWRTAYSSLFLGESSDAAEFAMDGETLRTSLATRVGLGAGFDVSFELPIAHFSGGFLDDFVIAWHDTFGLPEQGRGEYPHDDFRVDASLGDDEVFRVEDDGVRLLDVPIVLAWRAIELKPEQPFGVLFRGGVELPTGDGDAGYGSDGPDWMLGAVAELRTGVVGLNAHVEHTWASTPDRAARTGFSFADVTSGGFGTEVALSDAWSGLAQIEADQSTLRHLPLSRASDDQWLGWFGLRWAVDPGTRVEFGIGEDLSEYVAPDFTAWFAVTVDLGGG